MQCGDKSFQMIILGNICVYQTHHFNDYLSRTIIDLVSSDIGTITRFSVQLTRIIRVLLDGMHCPVIYLPEHIKLIRCFSIEVALIPLHITTFFKIIIISNQRNIFDIFFRETKHIFAVVFTLASICSFL